jgi:hypothetical protein
MQTQGIMILMGNIMLLSLGSKAVFVLGLSFFRGRDKLGSFQVLNNISTHTMITKKISKCALTNVTEFPGLAFCWMCAGRWQPSKLLYPVSFYLESSGHIL